MGIPTETRQRVLRSAFQAYYAGLPPQHIVFDTSRAWSGIIPGLSSLFPTARVICLVRSPAWILDSVERHAQSNTLRPPRMFNFDVGGTVYARAEALMKPGVGFVGYPWAALRQAWFGEHADRLIVMRYDSLVERPKEVIEALYDAIAEERFPHDFDRLEYSEPEFDAYIGVPGFHTVRSPIRSQHRQTILPPDLFHQYDGAFWDEPNQNPRGVKVL